MNATAGLHIDIMPGELLTASLPKMGHSASASASACTGRSLVEQLESRCAEGCRTSPIDLAIVYRV